MQLIFNYILTDHDIIFSKAVFECIAGKLLPMFKLFINLANLFFSTYTEFFLSSILFLMVQFFNRRIHFSISWFYFSLVPTLFYWPIEWQIFEEIQLCWSFSLSTINSQKLKFRSPPPHRNK